MASHVQTVVFHPTVSQSLKLWSTSLGREKTYRLIQYFARFYAWFLLRSGHTASASRWNSLKAALASGRKLLRLFKPIEHIQLALTSFSASPSTAPALERYAATLRQLSYAGYMAYDSLVWFASIRFLELDAATAGKYNRIAQKFWLTGIAFNIANGAIKLNRQLVAIRALQARPSEKVVEGDQAAELRAMQKIRSATRYQLVMDLFDAFLPASSLGYVDISDGLAGLIGITTSLMALSAPWAAAASAKGKN